MLEEKLMFLPLTNVTIRPHENGIREIAPFAAVNREKILSFQPEESVVPVEMEAS